MSVMPTKAQIQDRWIKNTAFNGIDTRIPNNVTDLLTLPDEVNLNHHY